MQKTRVRRIGALMVGLALVAASCGGDDSSTTTTPAATDAPVETEAPAETTEAPPETTEAPTETTEAPMDEVEAFPGALAGMRGTTPKGEGVSQDWLDSVNEFWTGQGNPDLTDFSYAAESYDAVIVLALAVHAAGDDGSAHAAEIVGVTRDGEKCFSFVECRDILDAGGDIDFDGISGPLEFNGNGEPLDASYAVLEFGADNRLDESLEYLVALKGPESLIVPPSEIEVDRAGDGVFTIGSFLPETGNLAFLGPPEFAGVEFAIAEVNAAGGVLGGDIQYVQGDSGDTNNAAVGEATIDRLLSSNVDAIIGAASSGVTLNNIDNVVNAGVTMFSPANTAIVLSTYDDKGLYFRNAPSDGLQGALIADLIQEDGNASVYILNLDDAYGNGIAAVVAELLGDAGIEVLGVRSYDPGAATFDAEVAEVINADPDAVVLISFDEGSRILRTMVERGVGPAVKNFYGSDGNMGNALGENFDAGA